MELKIQSERVLAAAEKCPQTKEVLKELFPEVFPSYSFKQGQWFRDKSDCKFYVLFQSILNTWNLVNVSLTWQFPPRRTVEQALENIDSKNLIPIDIPESYKEILK